VDGCAFGGDRPADVKVVAQALACLRARNCSVLPIGEMGHGYPASRRHLSNPQPGRSDGPVVGEGGLLANYGFPGCTSGCRMAGGIDDRATRTVGANLREGPCLRQAPACTDSTRRLPAFGCRMTCGAAALALLVALAGASAARPDPPRTFQAIETGTGINGHSMAVPVCGYSMPVPVWVSIRCLSQSACLDGG